MKGIASVFIHHHLIPQKYITYISNNIHKGFCLWKVSPQISYIIILYPRHTKHRKVLTHIRDLIYERYRLIYHISSTYLKKFISLFHCLKQKFVCFHPFWPCILNALWNCGDCGELWWNCGGTVVNWWLLLHLHLHLHLIACKFIAFAIARGHYHQFSFKLMEITQFTI
jgi:hypothetical protein